MEALGKIFSVAVGIGLSCFSVGSENVGGIDISYFLFADETLIFCGADSAHLCNFNCLVLCFESISGLTINLAKSELISIGNVNNANGFARILGCKLSSFPMKYLGLPLGASFKVKSI
jgi:hypothetical protein